MHEIETGLISRRQLLQIGLGFVVGAMTATGSMAADDGTSTAALPETDLMKATPPSVFVADMGNFKTPGLSDGWGSWASAGKDGVKHNPANIDSNGRRDLASCFYPAIGVYDMSDPNVAEYHCQLLKMAGVDGISFNISDYSPGCWREKSMRLYVAAMQRYRLEGIVRYENKYLAKTLRDPASILKQSYLEMDTWFNLSTVKFVVSGRPVFMFFSFKLSPDEVAAWKNKFPADATPLILAPSVKTAYKGVIDGMFGWTGDSPAFLTDHQPYRCYVPPDMALSNSRENYQKAGDLLKTGVLSYYMAGVSPGFDDIGCWGWGTGPRKVERDDGNVYRARWDLAINSGVSAAFIPTWNDWQEGTTIEPSVEYGDQYLAITREQVARFKKTTPSTGSLLTPVWIFKVRKSTADQSVLSAAEKASQLIADGRYRDAEALIKPWADKLGLTELQVWNAPLRSPA